MRQVLPGHIGQSLVLENCLFLFFQTISWRLWKKMRKSGEWGGLNRRKRQLVCDFLILMRDYSSVGFVFRSFNILFCLFYCSSERQGEWSLCKRRLWNCSEVLHRRFNWTAGHAALVHQSSTSEFPFFQYSMKKPPNKLPNSVVKTLIIHIQVHLDTVCLQALIKKPNYDKEDMK